MAFSRLLKKLLRDPIAVSRARSLLACQFDMYRRSLCGSLRSGRSLRVFQQTARSVFAAACLALLATQVIADDWGPLSRESALVQLDSPYESKRREGLARLAEIGTDADVPYMLRRLHDDDPAVRGMAEQALWGLWLRPNDTTASQMFQTSVTLIQQNDLEQAIRQLDEIIAYKPEFAEAWNKRGDAYSHLGNLDRALADYVRVLQLNPYQFSVMQSCGEIWLERRDARLAAEYFRRALDLNPNLFEVAMMLRQLEEILENDRI
jgi:tetratricopeptide (TPR) repeat protein